MNDPFEDQIIDLLPVGLMILDNNLNIHSWNAWLENQTSISAEDVAGKRLIDIFPKFDNPRFEWAVQNAISSNSPQVLSQSLNHYVIPISIEHAKRHGILFMQQHVEIKPILGKNNELYALVTIIDVTANVLRSAMLVEISDRLENREHRDLIQNVYTRRYLWEWLKTQFILAENQRYDISCLLFKVDNIDKLSNGSDEKEKKILEALAERIMIPLRKSDLLIRYAENHFAAMLPCCHVDDAMVVANKIRQLVRESSTLNFRPGEVTCSLGVSVWTPATPCTGEELLKKADKYLYKAINGGGDQVQGPTNQPNTE